MKKLIIVSFAFALLLGSVNTVKAQTANGYVSFTAVSTTNSATGY